jgi:hypothetical protein
MNEAQLVKTIKAHIAKGDHASEKAEQHYITAGQHLKTLKATHGGSWAEWEELLKTKVGIGKSRASELMRIADGRKTVEQVRADTAERTAKTRALQSSPLRSGENADDPETSANAMRARFAETDDDDGPDLELDHVRVRTAFLLRANAAQKDAFYDGAVDNEVLAAAEEAARAWDKVAASIRLMVHNALRAPEEYDPGPIPEFLRRAPKAAAS